jgi:hypothetical protein
MLMKLRLFKFMNLLGRHSLQVFVFSLFVTVPWFGAGLPYWAALSGWAKFSVALATVLSLAIPAWLHETYRARERSNILAVQGPALSQGGSVGV